MTDVVMTDTAETGVVPSAKQEPEEAPPVSPQGDALPTLGSVEGDTDISINDTMPKLRPQKPPLPATIRKHKPPVNEVVVLSLGSSGICYGYASDSTPKRVFPAVAFRRRQEATASPFRVPSRSDRPKEDIDSARKAFEDECERVVSDLALLERRRGGGKPIPWRFEVEPEMDEHWDDESWLLNLETAELENGNGGEQSQQQDQNQNKDGPEKVKAEAKQEDQVQEQVEKTNSKKRTKKNVLIGNEVLRLMHDEESAKHYDIIFPVWDGRLVLDCGPSTNLVRKAIDALLDHIFLDLQKQRNERKMKRPSDAKFLAALENHTDWMRENAGLATTFVTLVVPETAQRRDVAELAGAVFRSSELKCGALFVHQSAVSCALGAGLATCAVVDIGHSATVIACIEDGMVCGESRIHLRYGFQHVRFAFEELLNQHSQSRLHTLLVDDYRFMENDENQNKNTVNNNDSDTNNTVTNSNSEEADIKKRARRAAILDDEALIVSRICEQATCFNIDENDTLCVSQVTATGGSERSLRVKLGIGFRTVPAHGLFYPELLRCARNLQAIRPEIPVHRDTFQKNANDDNFMSDIFTEIRRSAIALAALPIGLFANDPGQPAETTVNADTASIVDAIVWSIAKAIEVKRPDQTARTPDHYRRYLNAIVLAGGGAKIDGIGPALESRIKKGFQDIGLNISDVTVIDGGRGKGDEELAAAAAVLKEHGDGGLLDDTDTASLPWKGGAVMVEADAVNEYWLYRDEWESRAVLALRERLPFYW